MVEVLLREAERKHAAPFSYVIVFGRISLHNFYCVPDFGSVVKLKIDTGKVFAVQIPKRSFNEMDLDIRSDVFLAFKASSVNLA